MIGVNQVHNSRYKIHKAGILSLTRKGISISDMISE